MHGHSCAYFRCLAPIDVICLNSMVFCLFASGRPGAFGTATEIGKESCMLEAAMVMAHQSTRKQVLKKPMSINAGILHVSWMMCCHSRLFAKSSVNVNSFL